MANATVSRLGLVNNTGTDYTELFLKVMMGEILTSFERSTVTLDKHQIRTIPNGKSAAFPATGTIGAEYHTPGTEIVGLPVLHNEIVITIDALLISHAFIASIDEAMNHYDVRSTYSTEMGRKLAQEMDINIFCELIKAARTATPLVTGGPVGSSLVDSNFGSATAATQAAALLEGIYAAKQKLQEKDVDTSMVYCALKPAEYNLLIKTIQSSGFSAIHKDYGGVGSYAEGTIGNVGGVQLVMSNNVPTTDLSARPYHGVNASTVKAIVWTPQAVGTVKLMDLATEAEWDIRRQGTLMVAKYIACFVIISE